MSVGTDTNTSEGETGGGFLSRAGVRNVGRDPEQAAWTCQAFNVPTHRRFTILIAPFHIANKSDLLASRQAASPSSAESLSGPTIWSQT